MRLLVAVTLAILTAGSADAKVVVVQPGAGTPLQDAISAAAPGDRLIVLEGTYAEAITIDKQLRVEGKPYFQLEAGCEVPAAVTITGDRAELRNASIHGGSVESVSIVGADRVKVRASGTSAVCPGVQRGFHIAATTRLLLKQVTASAWDSHLSVEATCHSPLQQNERQFPYAFVIEDIAPAAGNQIVLSGSCNAKTGFLIRNTAGAPKGPPGLKLSRSGAVAVDEAGIVLENADDVAIVGSGAGPKIGGAPRGIALDATSDDNVVKQCVFKDFVTDVFDGGGSSNCWLANRFDIGTVPTTGCP